MSDESDEKRESMAEGTLISHLLELRDRLMRAVICIALVFAPCAYYSNLLFTTLAHPLMKILLNGVHQLDGNLHDANQAGDFGCLVYQHALCLVSDLGIHCPGSVQT